MAASAASASVAGSVVDEPSWSVLTTGPVALADGVEAPVEETGADGAVVVGATVAEVLEVGETLVEDGAGVVGADVEDGFVVGVGLLVGVGFVVGFGDVAQSMLGVAKVPPAVRATYGFIVNARTAWALARTSVPEAVALFPACLVAA